MATEPDFDGTSNSAAHIGATKSTSLAALIDEETELTALVAVDAELLLVAADVVGPTAVDIGATPGADAGNTMPVVLVVTDAYGDAVTAAVRLKCTMYHATMIQALAAAWTLAETGAGTEVSTTAQASLILDTSTAGLATVTVSDVATGTAETMYMTIEPIGAPGAKAFVTLAFTT